MITLSSPLPHPWSWRIGWRSKLRPTANEIAEAIPAVGLHGESALTPEQAITAQDIIDYYRPRTAGYKRSQQVAVIDDDQMPRTATGRNLHRLVRERVPRWLGEVWLAR